MKNIKNEILLKFAAAYLKKAGKIELKRSLDNSLDMTLEQCIKDYKEGFTRCWGVELFKKALSLKERRAALAGNLSENAFKKAAKLYITRENEADVKKAIERAARVINGANVEEICITTDWVDSRTWGANPHTEARIWTDSANYDRENPQRRYYEATGTASGCGYDKHSTAAAHALRGIEPIEKLIITCAYMDYRESKKKKAAVNTYGYTFNTFGTRLDWGVGITCFYNIFRRAGLTLTAENSGKMSYFVQFNRK